MGVLDEAIREHLELKRRRGADSGEVARQEREALGAVNRSGEAERSESPGARDADPGAHPRQVAAGGRCHARPRPAVGELWAVAQP